MRQARTQPWRRQPFGRRRRSSLSGPARPQRSSTDAAHRALCRGTPELHAFVGQLKLPAGRQCYVIALADVNLQVLAQMGNLPKRVSIIATQAVPLVSASLPVVRAYREALAVVRRTPSPQGLAGLLQRGTRRRCCNKMTAPLTRANVLAALQQRKALNVGGWIPLTKTKTLGSICHPKHAVV